MYSNYSILDWINCRTLFSFGMSGYMINSGDPDPDSAFCDVWSESALFDNYPKMGYEISGTSVCSSVATDDRL